MHRRLLPSVPVSTLPIADTKALGALVRSVRLAQGFRIDDMAAFCGVSQDLMSRLENGRPVTSEKLLQVLHRMGLAMLVLPKADIPPNTTNKPGPEENPDG